MSSDLRPLTCKDSSAPPSSCFSSSASASSQMSSSSSASAWTNEVPLPARLKTTAPTTTTQQQQHDFTLPIITLSKRGSNRGGCRMDDPLTDEGGPRCISLPLGGGRAATQQRPRHDPAPPPPAASYAGGCSSTSLDNLSLFAPSGACGPSAPGGRLIKASSDNPVYGLSASPPVPPRDYIPRATSRPSILDHQRQPQQPHASRAPEIHPIVQDGEKRSNTHYWLLPDKQRTSASLDDVDKMTDEDDDQQHYVNVAGGNNGVWARKGLGAGAGVSKASSFGHNRKQGSSNVRPGEDSKRSHHASEGHAGESRSHFYSTPETVPLLSDVSSIDSVSIDLPSVDSMEDARSAGCPAAPASSAPASSDEGGCVMPSMGEVKEMIDTVRSMVDGVTGDECFTALATHQWTVHAAVEYLKVESLFRLGLASRERCRRRLELNDWNLERAASDLLDLIGIHSCK